MISKSLCVFCGSSPGTNPKFANEAAELGKLLVENGITLVYGGASIGVMGALADSVLENGGKVFGAMPKQLVDREVAHPGLTRLFVTNSMHERKALMANLSDGFAALPGGFGTFEELFEAITWSQLDMHRKPVMVMNTDGFYQPMIDFIEHTIGSGFIKNEHRNIIRMCEKPEDIIRNFLTYNQV